MELILLWEGQQPCQVRSETSRILSREVSGNTHATIKWPISKLDQVAGQGTRAECGGAVEEVRCSWGGGCTPTGRWSWA